MASPLAQASTPCGGFDAPDGDLSLAGTQVALLGSGGAYLGAAVATGDLDGDGIADLVVGAPREDVGARDGGAVLVFWGPLTSGTLSVSDADAVVHGPRAALAGSALEIVPDSDGDGLGELVVGSFSQQVWVVPGSALNAGAPASLDDVAVAKVSSGASGSRFGRTLKQVGDVDGDGLPELVIGAELASVGRRQNGAAYLYSLPMVGLLGPADADVAIAGAADNDRLGRVFVGESDWDGDGVSDLVMSSPRAASSKGRTYVFLGGVLGSQYGANSADVILEGAGAVRSGWSLSARDVDGDQATDLLIGATDAAGQRGGAYLVHGGPALLGPLSISDVAAVSLEGVSSRSKAGAGVALGDLNGDGLMDAIVGAPKVSTSSVIRAGVAYVSFGPHAATTSLATAEARFFGTASYAQTGEVLAVDDLNDDGFDDLVVGTWRDSSGGLRAGRVSIVFGGQGAIEPVLAYTDGDGDGFGDPLSEATWCPDTVPSSTVAVGSDCDDAAGDVYPGAVETCADTVDKNCDGAVGLGDGDGDGFAACEECDDGDAAISPDADEVCGNGIDDDCDGETDDATAVDALLFYVDSDGDGYGLLSTVAGTCDASEVPDAAVMNGEDCDDGRSDIHPDADEVCDDLDNNCDGDIDGSDALDQPRWYADEDGDGFGFGAAYVDACEVPEGHVSVRGDCDDLASAVSPYAVEICDGVDNDCDGMHYLGGTVSASSGVAALVGRDLRGELGRSLAFVGDVDGDGRDDLAAGSAPSLGHVWVFSGSHLEGSRTAEPGADVTASLALGSLTDLSITGGDLTSDGISDLVVGAVGRDCEGGPGSSVMVFQGPLAGALTSTDASLCFSADAASDLGADVLVYDLDGDGRLDLAIGAPGSDAGRGLVHVLYGASDWGTRDGGITQLDAAVQLEDLGGTLGAQIAAGDVNGDGLTDLVVGAPGANEDERGAVAVVWGQSSRWTGTLPADAQLDGVSVGGRVGSALAVPGDVDGDGLDDILLGTRDNEARLVRGATLGAGHQDLSTRNDVLFTGVLFAGAGRTVGGRGDLNGDGLADMVVSAAQADVPSRDAGAVYVIYGRSTFSDLMSPSGEIALSSLAHRENMARGVSAEGAEITGALVNGELGTSVAVGGDVNGDGAGDLAVGAPLAEVDGVDRAGTVYVLLGGPYGTDLSSSETCDTDEDGCADEVDTTPGVASGDSDGDGLGDDCDLCTGDDALGDVDWDGVCDVDGSGDGSGDGDGDGASTCPASTPWEVIAASLHDEVALLPTVPTEPLIVSWDPDQPEVVEDWILPDPRDSSFVPDDTICDAAPYWPTDRVTVGPLLPGTSGDRCRVRYKNTPTDPGLFVVTRDPIGSIHVPVSGEPGWAQFRFPVPPNHDAKELSWRVSWARLFGSNPQTCHGNELDAQGVCTTAYLAPDEDWSEEVPPGLFMLWAEPGDCPSWIITGPHEPASDISYSSAVEFSTEVPEALRDAEEVVVSMLVYHQYPGGCDGGNCVSAQGTYFSIGFQGAMLRSEEPFAPVSEPYSGRPRIFGDDATWLAEQAAFDELPCRGAPDYEDGAGWGTVTNVRNMWDRYTKGGEACTGDVPTTIEEHPYAGTYLDGAAALDWDMDNAYRTLHLIRRVRACHATTAGPCQYTLEEIDALVAAFIPVEIDNFGWWNWWDWPFGFDLRTELPMRYWSIFVDTLWDDLTLAEHALIRDESHLRASLFLENYDAGHWSLYNGNNWTPVLAKSALIWAVAYYWEEDIAPLVARRALQSMWLHEGFYLSDGAYLEGLMMYTQVSFNSIQEANRISRTSFGEPLQSVRWSYMPAVADWTLDFIAPDGLTVDFGDSWSKRGWGSMMPLLMMLTDELTGTGTASLDPCRVRRFFSNKYYDHGLRDPWFVEPALAKDWAAIADQCPSIAASTVPEVTVLEEGGWGAIRVGRPGSTALAANGDVVELRYEQADQTYLAVSAIPNERSHTELDFGTVIWSAYGSRLLWDLGYGSIGGNLYLTDPEVIDNNPMGHNTLVIPEAVDASLAPSPSNTSQIDQESGTIVEETVDGISLIHLDGAAVYGRDNPELGWLSSFDRRIVPVDGGHFVIIDAFEVRSDRPEALVQEYWYSAHQQTPPDPSACSSASTHVGVSVPAADRVLLEPVCANLTGASESAGLIVGAAVNAGQFVHDTPISFTNRLNQIEYRARTRWVPDAPVRDDLRVFALVSAAGGAAQLPDATVAPVACAAAQCMAVTIGDSAWTLAFGDAASGYPLQSITPAP